MSETQDQARTRRRWIGLAEIVGVGGLLIAGTTLYLQWSDRQADKAAAASESAAAKHARSIVTLAGAVSGEAITLSDPAHTISAATVRLPTALGVAAQDAMPGPAVRADWFAKPLLKLTDKGADERSGRLPVLVTTTWWDGDAQRQDAAIYDVMWRTEGQLLGGRSLKLTGWALAERSASQAALDRRWKSVAPHQP